MKACQQHPKSNKRSKGLSLISTLISVAVVSIIALTVTTILRTMYGTMTRTEAQAAVDNSIRFAQAIFINKEKCDNALRTASGQKVVFSPDGTSEYEVPVDRIMLDNAIALQTGQDLSNHLRISEIVFKEKVPNAGRGNITIGGIDYNTYVGAVEFRYQALSNLIGGSLKTREIPVSVATDPNGNTIEFCYESAAARQICEQLGGTIDANGNCTAEIFEKIQNTQCTAANSSPCPDPPLGSPTVTVDCKQIYYVEGFDLNAEPRCSCQQICNSVQIQYVPGGPGGPWGGSGGGSGPGGY